jgi:hypothetical protein
MNLLRNVWNWISGQIVGEVPEQDAICEFDCPRLQCTEGDWDGCERRLHRAAGELMPTEKPPLVALMESAAALEPPSESVVESTSPKGPVPEAVDILE